MAHPWIRRFVKQVPSKPFRRTRPSRRPRVVLRLEILEDRSLMSASALDPGTAALQQIDHFVVIYQENWSFDALYGSFPGANGIADASQTALTQIDRLTGQPYSSELGQPFDLSVNGPSLTTPPQPINNGAIDPRFPSGLDTLLPYNVGNYLSPDAKTGDIVHRFYQEQSQINGGAQNQYMTWSDNPGLVMSHFDATNLPEGLLAQQYTMDDNFFHAAFGGSFLNHQFLVAAAAPVYPNAPSATLPLLDANGHLMLNQTTGKIVQDGKVTPTTAQQASSPFDQNYAINTIFSANLAPDFLNTTVSPNNLLPSQNDSDPTKPNYIPTIGDLLDNAGVAWKWYSGGWDNALAGSPSNPANNGKTSINDPADPNFQWHHQPLAYYDNFAPWLANGQRNPLSAAHLQDELNFFQDLSAGNLPAVSFIKPLGPDNEHPGYTDLLQGQQHVADIVHALQNSPDWAHTAIIITYDENGGRWDHVAPPDANGLWGDGTRVPTIVISPYAKQGYVDHTQHDTLSILSTIEQRFGLSSLNNLDKNASTLASDFQLTPHVSLGNAYLQPDADNPGSFVLIVQGTEGDDRIDVTNAGTGLRVRIKGEDGVPFDQTFDTTRQTISRLEVYGQGGDDRITVADDVTIPAFLFGGNGEDRIRAGGGPTVVVGGGGEDTIIGGSGPSILIGGSEESKIRAGSGGSILIGGTTDFDSNAEALRALLKEWSSTSETFQQKMDHLTGAVPGGQNELTSTKYLLTTATVHDNGESDELKASKTQGVADWIFAHLSGHRKDDVDNLQAGDVVTAI
jgi:phospholipase C